MLIRVDVNGKPAVIVLDTGSNETMARSILSEKIPLERAN
jgi:hypothetical protein